MPSSTAHATQTITTAARSLLSVAPAIVATAEAERALEDAAAAAKRGYFRPGEDESLRIRFGRYLIAREALLETISELKPLAVDRRQSPEQIQAFFIAYTAACLLVSAARFLIQHVVPNPLLRRKLDEAEPRFGIPRKKFTEVYRSLTSPVTVWSLYQAREFARSKQADLDLLQHDPVFEEIAYLRRQHEPALDVDLFAYARARVRYRSYSLLRRHISGYQHALFTVLEMGGRVVAEIRNPLIGKQVRANVIAQMKGTLQPGDILITRHRQAASNLFLPGFWPHSALFIGDDEARARLGVRVNGRPDEAAGADVLEAKKDGVRLRSLTETLNVDYFTAIRPLLTKEQLAEALSRGLTHTGKLYDFSFDFGRADRLVCTEVIYRTFDGIGGIELELTERAGRPTLSAEDLLHCALNRRGFTPIAIFGLPGAQDAPQPIPAAEELLRTSLRLRA